MELIEVSEMSVNNHLTPGNYPKESILHSQHGESLKSTLCTTCLRTSFKIVPLNNLNKYLYNGKREIKVNISNNEKFLQNNATIGQLNAAQCASVVYVDISCT
jgi:hypothetical protein